MSKAQLIDAEVLHDCPDCGRKNFTAAGLRSHACNGGKLATVASLPLVADFDLTESEMVKQIKADQAAFDNVSRNAAIIALRIGLRLVWIKNNAPHGSLETFIRTHFDEHSRRTLARYIKIADQFVTDAGLRDGKTFKLTDSAKIAPILHEQLELFTDPHAKLNAALTKVVKWIGDRGLTQIYRDLSHEDAALPPTGHQGSAAKKMKTPEQKQREEFEASLTALKSDFSAKRWQHLFEKDRLALEHWLTKAGQTVREYNAACAKKTRRK